MMRKQRTQYDTVYGIFEIKVHDHCGQTTPELCRGWFDDPNEALECLHKWYNDENNKKRYDNDFYGYHYTYWHVIYARRCDDSPVFYDMGDYVKDLIDSGEWDKLSDEQKSIIVNGSDFRAKLRLLFEGKIKIKTNGTS
jgi:hypothetical protein